MDNLPATDEWTRDEALEAAAAAALAVAGVPVEMTPAHVDPSKLGFPITLPLELALGEALPREICASYNIDKDRFVELCALPAFQKAFSDAKAMLAQDGMSFRLKARMQAEEYLKTAWAIVHNPHTAANIKADLIKATWKVAGVEPKAEGPGGGGTAMQINIHLGSTT